MATPQPYNLFAKPKPLEETPQLTVPVEVYDPNQGWRGAPSAEKIAAAQRTPQATTQPQQTPKLKTPKMEVTPENETTAGMDYLNSLYTDPREEERLRKASLMNQRILAVGDALRHIGNIYNTANGAPSQQFNNPTMEEYARYEKSKAMRDAANAKFYSYQQQKALQDAKMRQFEREQDYKNRMLAHYQDQDKRLWARDAETARRNSVLEYLKEQQMQLNKEFQEKKISIAEYNARTSRINAERRRIGGGGSGKGMDEYTVTSETKYNYDNLGNKTGSTTTKVRTVNGKEQPKQTTKSGGTSSSNSSASSANNFGAKKHNTPKKGGNNASKGNNFGVRRANQK